MNVCKWMQIINERAYCYYSNKSLFTMCASGRKLSMKGLIVIIVTNHCSQCVQVNANYQWKGLYSNKSLIKLKRNVMTDFIVFNQIKLIILHTVYKFEHNRSSRIGPRRLVLSNSDTKLYKTYGTKSIMKHQTVSAMFYKINCAQIRLKICRMINSIWLMNNKSNCDTTPNIQLGLFPSS